MKLHPSLGRFLPWLVDALVGKAVPLIRFGRAEHECDPHLDCRPPAFRQQSGNSSKHCFVARGDPGVALERIVCQN